MKQVIDLQNISKQFVIKVKKPGFKNTLKNLFKPSYKKVKAVNNISIKIEEGELVGFIGPNGAGKSTTIKMLCGILHPTTGSIEVLGLNPQEQRVKLAYKIGTIFGQRQQLWYHLPAMDSYNLFKAVYDIPKKAFEKRLHHLINLFDIKKIVDQPVRKLSLGQRMKCEFVASLLHNPKILFLDEPTIGMDILAKKNMREFIRKINKEEKTTILLTSHDLEDIEQLCPRIVIINNGKILFDGPTEDIKKRLKYKIVEIFFDKELKKVPSIPGTKVISKDNFKVKIRVDSKKIPVKKVLSYFIDKYAVADILIEDPPIEQVIERLYSK